ncbi:ABC transporter permease [Rhizobium sp. LEGMi198b]
MTKAKSRNLTAWEDVSEAISNFRLATLLGWLDVAQRYRRSRIGPFWLTINMGVLVGALGLVFGTIFNTPMAEFLPFICIGLILWGYCTQTINESCTSFISSTDTILQLPIPFFTYVMRTWWRNTVILFHNLVIFPLILIFFGKFVNFYALLAIPGLVVLSFNLLWLAVVLAVLCTRYRDLTQIVQNVMQIGMYVTPIMWMPNHLPEKASHLMLGLNPFYHLVSIVREPLLGNPPMVTNWIFSIATAIVGWCAALLFFGRYRSRIAYWL